MEMVEMKTLTIEDTTFEIVDAHVRNLVGKETVAKQIEEATANLATVEQVNNVSQTIIMLEDKVTESTDSTTEIQQIVEQNTQVVTEMQTMIENKVDQEVVTQLETDLKTYIEEQLKTVVSESIDDGRL